MRSPWDRLTTVSTYGPLGSEEDDEPNSGWDFSGLDNPSAMRDFMTACDYCLSDCFDSSHSLGDEGCGPSRECFQVDLGGLDEGNHLGMTEDGDPPRPAPRVDILRELVVVPVPAGGQDARGSRTTCAASAKYRAGVGRPSTGRRSVSPGPGRPAPHRRRCQGEVAPGFQWGRPEPGCSSDTTPSDARTIHHRGAAYPGRAQESPGRCCGTMGRKLCLPKAGVSLGASRRDFPIHAGSLGPHRANAEHSACGPGSPQQRAPPP
jgi:hypothetical protein